MNWVEFNLIPVANTIANQDNQLFVQGRLSVIIGMLSDTDIASLNATRIPYARVDHSTAGLVQTLDLLQITHHHWLLDALAASQRIRPVSASNDFKKPGTRD